MQRLKDETSLRSGAAILECPERDSEGSSILSLVLVAGHYSAGGSRDQRDDRDLSLLLYL